MGSAHPEPAPWQAAVLYGSALVFLSALLGCPLRALLLRLRRPATPAGSPGAWGLVATAVALVASVAGVLCAGMLAMMPMLFYSGFLGWLDLPLWQRVMLHMPLLLAVCAVVLLALSAPAWRWRWWSGGQRVHFAVVTIAAAALVLLLNGWHLIGLSV